MRFHAANKSSFQILNKCIIYVKFKIYREPLHLRIQGFFLAHKGSDISIAIETIHPPAIIKSLGLFEKELSSKSILNFLRAASVTNSNFVEIGQIAIMASFVDLKQLYNLYNTTSE